MVRIYADFQNADAEGYLRLNTEGTRADLDSAGLALCDGLQLKLSDGEFEANAVVVKPGSEGIWRAEISWDALEAQ